MMPKGQAPENNARTPNMKIAKAAKTAKAAPKIDLCELYKSEYTAPRKPAWVDPQPAVYLAIDGQGAPGGTLFQASIEALYGMAYTIKMTRKFAGAQDYAIGKLEGRWGDDSASDFSRLPRDQWRWQLLIRTPDFVKPDELDRAVTALLKRGKGEDVRRVRLTPLTEGRCVQMLHVGPYEREAETVALLRAFAEQHQFRLAGRHHEIYLSDPRRVPPERLKTILRHPVVAA
jgi:hypothetical protein